MKRTIALSLAFVMLLLTACRTTQPPVGDTTPGTVATTDSTEPSGTTSTVPTTEAAAPTTIPTEAPTTAPTTEPTEAATEPPTESTKATEPTDGDSSSTGGTEETTEPTKPTEGTEPPEEAKLSLNKTSLSLDVGESYTLKATYSGNKSLSWSSTNSGIASVSNKGKVTAKSAGTAIITVSDGVKSAQCVVTVTNPPAKEEAKLTLEKTSLSLDVGATSTLGYEYTGSGTLTWTSSNSSVASVSNGKVTAKSAGTATITLTDGKLKAECKVTVTSPAVGELTIKTPHDTVVYVGESLQIEYTYTGDKSALVFKSDDTYTLTVTNSGKVTGVEAGMVYVDVYHGSTSLGYVRLVVLEKPAPTEPKPVAKSINVSNITGPYFDGVSGVVGNYMTFTSNANTDGDHQSVTATSSNSGVASIELVSIGSSNKCKFKVKFVGAGSATIIITSEDGNVSKSYTITVKSGYSSARSGSLTPEEFVSCVNGIMKENGATIDTSMGYLVETVSEDKLTGSNARAWAESYIREFWPNGKRYMGLAYQGVNEDGKHVFYIHR